MNIFKSAFGPIRTRRLRHLRELSDHLRKDIGLPAAAPSPGLDLAGYFFPKRER